MSVRRSAGRALCGATLVCLTACGSTAPDVPTPVITWTAGIDPDIAVPTGTPVATAGWGAAGRLRVVTWGSSGCPALPESVTSSATTITIRTSVRSAPGAGCTADATATTAVVDVPAGVDTTRPVTVIIDDTTVQLPAR